MYGFMKFDYIIFVVIFFISSYFTLQVIYKNEKEVMKSLKVKIFNYKTVIISIKGFLFQKYDIKAHLLLKCYNFYNTERHKEFFINLKTYIEFRYNLLQKFSFTLIYQIELKDLKRVTLKLMKRVTLNKMEYTDAFQLFREQSLDIRI